MLQHDEDDARASAADLFAQLADHGEMSFNILVTLLTQAQSRTSGRNWSCPTTTHRAVQCPRLWTDCCFCILQAQ
jgi:hypothetical protein